MIKRTEHLSVFSIDTGKYSRLKYMAERLVDECSDYAGDEHYWNVFDSTMDSRMRRAMRL